MKLTEIYVLVVDEGEGREGIAGMVTALGAIPLVASSADNLTRMMGAAQAFADKCGKTCRLVSFSGRREMCVYAPSRPHN